MPVVPVVLASIALLFFAIIPTVTYVYVEKRSRRHWLDAAAGASVRPQRAPVLVRAVAWLSLAFGQLAVPALAAPITCGSVVFMLAKLGKANVSGTALLVVLGASAVIQAFFALRLFPFGIRLLARDAKLKQGNRFVRSYAAVQSLALAAAGLNYALLRAPGFLNPIVRTTVFYGGILPVAAVSALGLLLAAAAARATKALA